MSFFFFSSRRRHTRSKRDWSSDVCSSDLVGKLLRRPAGLLDIGEHIERALRLEARETFDLVDASIKAIAAAAKLGVHAVDGCLITVQCLDSGNLGEASGAGI